MAVRGCCGLDLRSSAMAVAIVCMSFSAVHLLGIIVGWAKVASDLSDFQAAHGVRPAGAALLYGWVFAPQLAFVLLSLLFNALLLLAVRRRSACAALAWLIYYAIVFVLVALASVGLLIGCGVLSAAHSELQRQAQAAPPAERVNTFGTFGRPRPGPVTADWQRQDGLRVAAEQRQDGLRVAAESAYVASVVCGVLGALGLLASPLLWYWYVLVLAFYREISDSYSPGGAARPPHGGEPAVQMSALGTR
ncbi:hypothetical protein FJT64_002238 [Amphibalanus amphitrite]|uniref:Uncharacterized protein n=1 Tax=Amphibalanus amphitrite TaxID=1232801 RepID=A0A6A4WZU6_AMPAM|nr:hypothetical protein FJT64_002238 [Amphibalanus amphitrite]